MDNLEYVLMSRRSRQKKIRARRRLIFIITLLLIISIISTIVLVRCSCNSGLSQGPALTEPAYPITVDGIPVTTRLLPEGCAGRPGTLRQIKYVVIHDTDNTSTGANAKNHANYLENTAKETPLSWHYTVDDHEIFHHLPDNEVAYHAADGEEEGGGNKNGVAIEICVNEDGDFEKAFQNGAKLAAYLLNAYNLTPADLRQHYDFSGKNCPRTIRENGRWQEFINLVTERYNQYQSENSE